jgi:hypothetical protein
MIMGGWKDGGEKNKNGSVNLFKFFFLNLDHALPRMKSNNMFKQ